MNPDEKKPAGEQKPTPKPKQEAQRTQQRQRVEEEDPDCCQAYDDGPTEHRPPADS